MKKIIHLPTLLLVLLFVACSQMSDIDTMADELYAMKASGNYEALSDMLDSDALQGSTITDWQTVVHQPVERFGDYVSHNRVNFSFNSSDGITHIDGLYEVEYENGTLFEQISVVDRGDGFKFRGYRHSPDRESFEDED